MTKKLITRVITKAGTTELFAEKGVVGNTKLATTVHNTYSPPTSDANGRKTYPGSTLSYTTHKETFQITYEGGGQETISLNGGDIRLHTGQKVRVMHLNDKKGSCFYKVENYDEGITYTRDIKYLSAGTAAIHRPLGKSAFILSLIFACAVLVLVNKFLNLPDYYDVPILNRFLPMDIPIFIGSFAFLYLIFWKWQKSRLRKQLDKTLHSEFLRYANEGAAFEAKDVPLHPSGTSILNRTGQIVFTLCMIPVLYLATPMMLGYMSGSSYASSVAPKVLKELDSRKDFLVKHKIIYQQVRLRNAYALYEKIIGDTTLVGLVIKELYPSTYMLEEEQREKEINDAIDENGFNLIPALWTAARQFGYRKAISRADLNYNWEELETIGLFTNFKEPLDQRPFRDKNLVSKLKRYKAENILDLSKAEAAFIISGVHADPDYLSSFHESTCFYLWSTFGALYYKDSSIIKLSEVVDECRKYSFIR